MILALSADVPYNKFSFRAYAEAELPMNPSWIRPVAHCPADYKNPVKEDRPTLIDRIGGDAYDGEHFPQYQLTLEQELKRTAKETYKAWRIHAGAEVKYSLSFGTVFLSADVQFHQDGQTLHRVGGYDKTFPMGKRTYSSHWS